MTVNYIKTAAILIICFSNGAASASDSVDFEKHILPLFYQRCFSCHSENKEEPKGGLRLDSVKAIRESGVIAPGKPDESELLIRISLPHEDDSFMPPPEGGAQPFDQDELAMMKAWIRNRASFGNWERFENRQAPLEVAGESLSMDDVPRLTAKLDELVEQSDGERNPPISDETFLRRIYLDVIGRIPTLAESRAFLDNSDLDKRANLIQQLLASEGFVSHMFNWKANQLRLDPNGIPGQPGWTYDEWVKEAIRSGTLTLLVSDLDERKSPRGDLSYLQKLAGMSADELWDLAGERLEIRRWHRDHQKQILDTEDAIRIAEAARDEAKVAQLKKQRDELRRKQYQRR